MYTLILWLARDKDDDRLWMFAAAALDIYHLIAIVIYLKGLA